MSSNKQESGSSKGNNKKDPSPPPSVREERVKGEGKWGVNRPTEDEFYRDVDAYLEQVGNKASELKDTTKGNK